MTKSNFYFPFGFKKQDFFAVTAILLLLIAAITFNLQISLRKGRDIQRKNDVRSVTDALHAYQSDFGAFPLADDQGRILACVSDPTNPKTDEYGAVVYEPCEWGIDGLKDVFDLDYPAYLTTLPDDPSWSQGRGYYYASSGSRFQFYASLESSTEPEYDNSIITRNLTCGNAVCNYGRAFEITPLDKSIEQYENELRERYLYEQNQH